MSQIVYLVCVSTSAAGFGVQALSAINQTTIFTIDPSANYAVLVDPEEDLRDEALKVDLVETRCDSRRREG